MRHIGNLIHDEPVQISFSGRKSNAANMRLAISLGRPGGKLQLLCRPGDVAECSLEGDWSAAGNVVTIEVFSVDGDSGVLSVDQTSGGLRRFDITGGEPRVFHVIPASSASGQHSTSSVSTSKLAM